MRNSTALSQSMIESRFNLGSRTRNWGVSHFGGFDAVTFQPLACCRFRPGEGGPVYSDGAVSLAPVSGSMRSNSYVQLLQVFVPYQCLNKMDKPDDPHAGNTEAIRMHFANGGEGIGLEPENAISRACHVHGEVMDDSGTPMVQKSVRYAYLAAINYLRQQLYSKAHLLDNTHHGLRKATLRATVLQRFDATLDPEPLADGAFNLSGKIPVTGIYGRADNGGISGENLGGFIDANGDRFDPADNASAVYDGAPHNQIYIGRDAETGKVLVQADLSGAGEASLRTLMNARNMQAAMRGFARIIENDPVHGEEAVRRAIYGLKMDVDDDPIIFYDQDYELTAQNHLPMTAGGVNHISGHFHMSDKFGVVVPRTELGGQLITLAVVRPLERLQRQPDPAQTEVWQPVNRVLDEMELDPQLVTRGKLESDCPPELRDQPAFYTGHNRLKHGYFAAGVNEAQTNSEVELKSRMWDYAIPAGVTPENVSYPQTLPSEFMYPFAYWNGHEAEYTFKQVADIQTTLAKGPTPIERMQLFVDEPELIAEQ